MRSSCRSTPPRTTRRPSRSWRRCARSPAPSCEVLGWDEAFLGVETDDPEAFARAAQAAVLRATRLHCSRRHRRQQGARQDRDGVRQAAGRLPAHRRELVRGDGRPPDDRPVGRRVEGVEAAGGARRHDGRASSPRADEAALVARVRAADGRLVPRARPRARLGRWSTTRPWVPRGHSRETTFQQNLTTPDQVRDAVRRAAAQVLEDIARDGRPVVRVALKVRYAPFVTKTTSRKLAAPTHDRGRGRRRGGGALAEGRAAARSACSGVRAEMAMPEEGDPAERTPVRGRI